MYPAGHSDSYINSSQMLKSEFTHNHTHTHTHTHIYIYIYIVIHEQNVSLYHTFSWELDTRDASNWNWKQADFTSGQYLTPDLSSSSSKGCNFFYVYIHKRFSATRVLNSWEELCIYAYVAGGNFSFVGSEIWTYVYILQFP